MVNCDQNSHCQSQAGKSLMEGRNFSDLFRNTSEELFIKSLMDNSMGVPVPTMEMLGFKNTTLHQNIRTDSEELFKSWLTNGENHGYSSPNISHRTRQSSRRISMELFNVASQQNGTILQKKKSNDLICSQNNLAADDVSNDLNQQSLRNSVDRTMQASNLFLAKAWFHSSQPMTRSRSSELRKRYAAMQNAQSSFGMEAMNNAAGHVIGKFKQEFLDPNMPTSEIPDQIETFMSPSNSSSSPFGVSSQQQLGNLDNVSSVVNMLKGTLERKKLSSPIEKETMEDIPNAMSNQTQQVMSYQTQQVMVNNIYDNDVQFNHHQLHEFQPQVSPVPIQDLGFVQGSTGLELEVYVNRANPNQFSMMSREPSQSESSAAAPVVSSGFEVCDGPSISNQAVSICESSRKEVKSSETGSKAKDFRDRIMDNIKDDRKRGNLVRYGSVTSSVVGSKFDAVDKGDPTKKRRVERSRKMAEAKERNLTPSVPSDMQTLLNRCHNLEKEVRSLKLNLSFMNRKDSEQTKQIEELQKQNEDLADEKERLLGEIERIISETGKMKNI